MDEERVADVFIVEGSALDKEPVRLIPIRESLAMLELTRLPK